MIPNLMLFADTGLAPFDWVVIVAYGIFMLCLGLHYGRKQKTTKDFFIGDGQLRSFTVGISLLATLISTISYLAYPGELIRHGPVIFFGMFSAIIVYIATGYWLIPAIMRRRVTSAYELLEQRTGLSGRLLAVSMFIAMRLFWMGLMLNICAEAMVQMLGLSDSAQPWIVAIAGTLAVGYTAVGGLRAVVMTDVIQFFLLMGGSVTTIILVTYHMDGFGWFPTTWAAHWDSQPLLTLDPQVRVSVVGSIVAGSIAGICIAGSDQVAIQRFMATPDVAAARRSFLVYTLADISVIVIHGLVGCALLGFYMAQPELIGDEGGLVKNADKLFPQFIANQLPVGICGLVVVALFAAVMSSVDSGINAVTAVVMTDLIGRFRTVAFEERVQLRLARWLTVVIGVMIVLLNTFVDSVPGNYVEVAQKTVNLFISPLFGLFFLALFVKNTTPRGAIAGTFFGIITAILIAFSGPLVHELHTTLGVNPARFNVEVMTATDPVSGETWQTCNDPISFQWIGPVALAVNILAGILLSQLDHCRERWKP